MLIIPADILEGEGEEVGCKEEETDEDSGETPVPEETSCFCVFSDSVGALWFSCDIIGPSMFIMPANGLADCAEVEAGVVLAPEETAVLVLFNCDIIGPSMLIMPAKGLPSGAGVTVEAASARVDWLSCESMGPTLAIKPANGLDGAEALLSCWSEGDPAFPEADGADALPLLSCESMGPNIFKRPAKGLGLLGLAEF